MSGLWMQMGPMCAVTPGVVHATDLRKPSKRRTVDTACGKKRARYRVMSVVNTSGERVGSITLRWPPKVADIAPDRRCPDCMTLRPGKPQSLPEGPLLSFGGPR